MDFNANQTLRVMEEGQLLLPEDGYKDGRYQLKEFAGEGGMGQVWRAKDLKMGADVALKFIPDRLRSDIEVVEQLKSEAIKGRRLTHQHIVAVYDFEQSKDHAALAMEFADGSPLSVLKAQAPEHCFNVPEIEGWIQQIGEALIFAHSQQRPIIHRDLKPANILTTSTGQAKIADFGIARTLTDSFARLTNTSLGGGSLGYSSPQQLGGKPPKVTDDVYSFGALIYDLLTGNPPFYTGDIPYQTRNEEPDAMGQRRFDLGVESKQSIPEKWEEVVARCLAKDAVARPQSIAEVLYEVGLGEEPRNLNGRTVTPQSQVLSLTQSSASFEGSKKDISQNKFWVSLVVVALFLFTGIGFFIWKSAGSESSKRGNAIVTVPIEEQVPKVVEEEKSKSNIVTSSSNEDLSKERILQLLRDAQTAQRKGNYQQFKDVRAKIMAMNPGADTLAKIKILDDYVQDAWKSAVAWVTLLADPPEAVIYLDGKKVLSGDAIELQGIGTHHLELVAAGYHRKLVEVDVKSNGETISVGEVSLQPTKALLEKWKQLKEDAEKPVKPVPVDPPVIPLRSANTGLSGTAETTLPDAPVVPVIDEVTKMEVTDFMRKYASILSSNNIFEHEQLYASKVKYQYLEEDRGVGYYSRSLVMKEVEKNFKKYPYRNYSDVSYKGDVFSPLAAEVSVSYTYNYGRGISGSVVDTLNLKKSLGQWQIERYRQRVRKR